MRLYSRTNTDVGVDIVWMFRQGGSFLLGLEVSGLGASDE
jgi:hypothetical protein